MRTLSHRSWISSNRSRRQRRLFLESFETRQMLTSVLVALHDPLYSTAVNTDLVISSTSSGIVNNDCDADGNLTAAEDPLGNTTSYTVNSRGQVSQITAPDPNGAGSLTASVTQFAYNSGTGTLSTITNPGSSTRTFT